MRYDDLISGIEAQIQDLQSRKKDLIEGINPSATEGI
jgi:hypothetical protein